VIAVAKARGALAGVALKARCSRAAEEKKDRVRSVTENIEVRRSHPKLRTILELSRAVFRREFSWTSQLTLMLEAVNGFLHVICVFCLLSKAFWCITELPDLIF